MSWSVLRIAPRVNHKCVPQRRPARSHAQETCAARYEIGGKNLTSNRKPRKPTPAFNSISDLIAEGSKVYRLARSGRMAPNKAAKLVWMLGQLRAMVETQMLERIEAKLDAMAAAAPQPRTINGHTSPTLPALAAH
jgi:hypothetical protein